MQRKAKNRYPIQAIKAISLPLLVVPERIFPAKKKIAQPQKMDSGKSKKLAKTQCGSALRTMILLNS